MAAGCGTWCCCCGCGCAGRLGAGVGNDVAGGPPPDCCGTRKIESEVTDMFIRNEVTYGLNDGRISESGR